MFRLLGTGLCLCMFTWTGNDMARLPYVFFDPIEMTE